MPTLFLRKVPSFNDMTALIQQYKAIYRFNRVFILVMAMLSTWSLWHHSLGLQWGLAALHFVFLMGNEFLNRLSMRFKESQEAVLQQFSLGLPLALYAYATLLYFSTGMLSIQLLGILAPFQAYILGRSRLAKSLAACQAILFSFGLLIHYPKPVFSTVDLVLTTFSVGFVWLLLGSQLSKLMRSHHTEVDKLQSLAATDALTGLTNRRQFNTRLQEEVARSRRHHTPLSLALFDLDHFKKLNDFYGHQTGDRVLKEMGKMIRDNLRECDLPARYGGEEFALILPETPESEAYDLLERLRTLISETVFCLPDNPLTVSISVGVSQLESRKQSAFELVEISDKALYEAKRTGRNRVVKSSSLSPIALITKNKV
jgi:diguanylate cyclase (GGDEF)-like protein